MGINDYGQGNQPLSAPQLSAWAAATATVLDRSDVSVNARIAYWLEAGTYTPPGDGVFNVLDFGAVGDGVTDDSTAVAAATAAAGGSGGEVLFPAGTYLVTTQIVLPNDSNLIPPPTQKPIMWRGQSGHYNGQNALGSGGTRLLLTYQGSGATNDAKVITRGLGVFVLRDMVLQDTTANSETPFVYTTLTTLKVHNVAVLGATSGTSCKQDAFILGGTKKYPTVPVSGNGYGDPDAPFQGYGTVISGNYFNRVRRAVYGRSYANQVVVSDNFFDKGCGTNLVGGACIEFDSSLTTDHPGDPCAANVITGNYMEWSGGYYYQIKLIRGVWNYIAGNAGEDSGANAVALVGLFGCTIGGTDYPSEQNYLVGNHSLNGVVVSEDTASSGRNTVIGGNYGSGIGTGTQFAYGEELTLHEPIRAPAQWNIRRLTDNAAMLAFGGSNITTTIFGPLNLPGNASGAGTTALTIGNNSTAAAASITLNAPSGQVNQIQLKRAGANSWLIYDGDSTSLFVRDSVNSKMHLTLTPGAGAGEGTTELNTALKIVGKVGFFNQSPQPKPTVTGSYAGNAALYSLLRALHDLGLITDSSSA